ncbi:MAG TPA: hypothetical protein VI094_12215 [Propionibacteriaceae bacterium]
MDDLVWSCRVTDIDADSLTRGVRLVCLDLKTAGASQKEQPNYEQ